MTEAEWLQGTDPYEMVRHRAGDPRKVRLFAVACIRQFGHLLTCWESRAAVAVAERFADDLAGESELTAARSAVSQVRQRAEAEWKAGQAPLVAASVARLVEDTAKPIGPAPASGTPFADAVIYGAIWVVTAQEFNRAAREAALDAQRHYQCALLRDLFGPLVFREVRVDPAWLDWQDGTVRKLARLIYAERRFDELGVLADALEEAGCTDRDILAHCRSGPPHVRGCWCVDLLLGHAGRPAVAEREGG
jgi:hypothetical protein